MRSSVPLVVVAALLLVVVTDCKKASSPAPPRACKSDDECVIACDRIGDCCHFPYCESAQHRDDADDAQKHNAKHCTAADQQKCPQIGSRLPPDYRIEVHCRESKCVADRLPLTDAGAP